MSDEQREWAQPLAPRTEASDWCPRCGHWYEGGIVSPSCCYARHRLATELARLTAELQQANRANAELRAVLEAVEWSVMWFCNHFDVSHSDCPSCGNNQPMGHEPTCPLGRALNRPECGETTDGT